MSPRLHPSLVLSAYVEPLIRGRRVAVLGDATIGLAEALAERGARLVHAYDPDPARTAEAIARSASNREGGASGHTSATHVSYAVLAGDLGVRDGAFDAVVVPDLSTFADPAEVLRRVRRLTASTGVAVIVSPNPQAKGKRFLAPGAIRPGAPSYYDLYDLVSLQFARVRMIGQAPFVGYTLADFAARGEPAVSVDTSLLDASEEPELFIAIASERPAVVDAYAVIELPWGDVADALGTAEGPRAVADDEETRLALVESRARVVTLGLELEKMRERQRQEARAAEERGSASDALSSRVVELERDLAGREARLRDVDSRAGDSHVRAERLTHQIRDLEEELRRQRERGVALTKQLDDEKRVRQKAELELGMIRGAGGREAPPSPEMRGAKERIEALTAELAIARARIAEVERLDEVLTPRPADLTTIIGDARLFGRLDALETQLAAAKVDAAESSQARDVALMRAIEAESRAHRAIELEASIGAIQRDREELNEELRLLKAAQAESAPSRAEGQRKVDELMRSRAQDRERVAELEKQLVERQRHGAELEQRLGEGRKRLLELERFLAEAERRIGELERRSTAANERAAGLELALAEANEQAATAGPNEAEAARAAAELADARASAEAASAEVQRLEEALRERGHVVAALQRDLRESERIGRELVDELEAAQKQVERDPEPTPVKNGVAAPVKAQERPAASHDVSALKARLDALAVAAARSEADLQAATWRIAQLTRELAEAQGGPMPATAVQRELEEALAAARDEVAALRRQTSA